MFEAIIYIFNISICYGISFNHPCKQYLFGRKWIQIMWQLVKNVLQGVSGNYFPKCTIYPVLPYSNKEIYLRLDWKNNYFRSRLF